MKKLYLLRHAKSNWNEPGLSDHDRPLDARGQRAAVLMGIHFAQRGISPSLVLCSSARRAEQTLERLRPYLGGDLGGDPRIRIERDLYGASPEQLLARLSSVDDDEGSVLVLGHNPGIAELAVKLAAGGDASAVQRMRSKFPTAGLAAFALKLERWGEVAPGCGQLTEFVTPKDLV